jgi:hypothetical protein
MPDDDVAAALTAMERLCGRTIEDLETEHDLPTDDDAGRRDGVDGAPLGLRGPARRGPARAGDGCR